MKIIGKISAMILACLSGMFAVSEAKADNVVSVNDFSVSSYEPFEVPVYLTNTATNILGYQMDITVPESLRLISCRMADDRKGDSSQAQLNTANGRFMVINLNQQGFVKGTEGPLFYAKLEAKDGSLIDKRTETLTIKNIKLSAPAGVRIESNSQATASVAIDGFVPSIAVSYNPGDFVLRPGGKTLVNVAVDNNLMLANFCLTLSLPKGVKYVDGSLKNADRVTEGTSLDATVRDNGDLNFLMYKLDNQSLAEGNGNVFSFELTADDSFTAETASISAVQCEAACKINNKFETRYGTAPVLTIKNEKIPYDNLISKANDLTTALNAALAKIAQDCPDVKDRFDGKDITAAIAVVKGDIDAAYNSDTIFGKVAEIEGKIAQIAKDIEALTAEAAEAQKAAEAEKARVEANNKAYNEDLAKIKDLEAAAASAVEEIKEKYPEYDPTKSYDAIKDMLKDMADKAAKELDSVAKEGEYESQVDADAVNAAISQMLKDAEDVHNGEPERIEANKKAYEADLALIESLKDDAAAALEDIKNDCPAYDASADYAAIIAALDEMKAKADKEYADTMEAGNYESQVNEPEIQEMIDAMIAAAKAAQEMDQRRQEENKAAYEADLAMIETLKSEADAAVAKILAENPSYSYQQELDEILKLIEEMKAAADAEYERVKDSGYYMDQVKESEVRALIEAMLAGAMVGVDSIFVDGDGDIQVFNLQGIRVNQIIKGQIYIIVKNGQKMKVTM